MANKVEMICKEQIIPNVNQLGYEVIELDYSKKIDGMNLTFTIYKKDGITMQDCETVHKIVSKLLEEINPTDKAPYILNVESEGLDRPIKSMQDFLRHKGEEYEIKLYAPINKQKLFSGLLVGYDDNQVSLEIDGKVVSIPKNKIANITPVLKF